MPRGFAASPGRRRKWAVIALFLCDLLLPHSLGMSQVLSSNERMTACQRIFSGFSDHFSLAFRHLAYKILWECAFLLLSWLSNFRNSWTSAL